MQQRQSHTRVFLLSAMSNYGATMVSMLVNLISIPVGLHYFGPGRYGVWLVISSLLTYFRSSDFGIGAATLTLVAQADGISRQRAIIWHAIRLMSELCAVMVMGILLLASLFPGWVSILGKVPPQWYQEAAAATVIVAVLMILQLPTTVFVAAFSGLQQAYWNRIYAALQSLTMLLALLITVPVGGGLVTLAIATGVGSLLVGCTSGVHLFLVHPELRFRHDRMRDSAGLTASFLASGMRFFALHVSGLIVLSASNLVISHILGPEAVTRYAVTFRVFYMGLVLVNGMLFALWPMHSQAFGRRDWAWMRKTYNGLNVPILTASGLVWILGVSCAEPFIDLWSGPAGFAGLGVAVALGGYVYVSSFVGANSSLINGLNPTRSVVLAGGMEALLNVGISLFLVARLGILGAALGTVIAAGVVNIGFQPFYIRRRTLGQVCLEVKPVLLHAALVCACILATTSATVYLPGWLRILACVLIATVYVGISWVMIPDCMKLSVRRLLSRAVAATTGERYACVEE